MCRCVCGVSFCNLIDVFRVLMQNVSWFGDFGSYFEGFWFHVLRYYCSALFILGIKSVPHYSQPCDESWVLLPVIPISDLVSV